MIYFNINIRNPYWWDRFDNIRNWSGSAYLKHKYWEIQLYKSAELFRIEFEWTVRQDHAGINFELGLFGYQASFSVYDSRHWDIDNDCWHITDHIV